MFGLCGYGLFRAARASLGGGVAIYVKTDISRKFVKKKSGVHDLIEYIFIEIMNDSHNLLTRVVYGPNNRIL